LADTHAPASAKDSVHGHHPAQQHQFESMVQQQESVTLGMWLFLVTEVLLFGGLVYGNGLHYKSTRIAFYRGR